MDSTLEALALHYVGIGLFAVNNVWTLVALVTAAVSFWRLRGAKLLLRLPDHRCRVGSLHEPESASEAIDSMPESSIREAAAVPATSVVSETVTLAPPCGDGATKGTFVVYYTEDEECDVAAAAETMVDEKEEEEVGHRRAAGEWWEGWEKAWRMRRKGAEKGRGWYDYQDLEVLNGSVVRLWEAAEEERQPMGLPTSTMTSQARQSMHSIVWW